MEEKTVERILIVGGCGGGKSTFSKILGGITGLQVYHLDKYFWKPGWVETARSEFFGIVEELISKESWVIEGNYGRSFRMRALRADKIFLFDYSSAKYVFRILKRLIKSKLKFEKRTDMADGCDEKLDWEFVKFTWNFNKDVRPYMYSVLEELNFNKNDLIIFKRNRDVKKYIQNLR